MIISSNNNNNKNPKIHKFSGEREIIQRSFRSAIGWHVLTDENVPLVPSTTETGWCPRA
jgi:hypothetical protein